MDIYVDIICIVILGNGIYMSENMSTRWTLSFSSTILYDSFGCIIYYVTVCSSSWFESWIVSQSVSQSVVSRRRGWRDGRESVDFFSMHFISFSLDPPTSFCFDSIRHTPDAPRGTRVRFLFYFFLLLCVRRPPSVASRCCWFISFIHSFIHCWGKSTVVVS